MQLRTERSLVTIGNRERPVVSVAVTPKSSPGYLIAGIALGVLLGFVLGSVVTLSVGDRSLAMVQALWNRLSGVTTDGERVHFEWLLQ
jgi:hypothetical protein